MKVGDYIIWNSGYGYDIGVYIRDYDDNTTMIRLGIYTIAP